MTSGHSLAADLFERHHVEVFRFFRRMDCSIEEAEDLTQEVFLRVVRSLPAYEERDLGRAWVFRIARNLWIDRRRAHHRSGPLEPLNAGDIASMPARQTSSLVLNEALRELSRNEREAFLMRELGGLGYAEIAQVTGATVDATRSRIYRARMALRRILRDTTTGPESTAKEIAGGS